MKFNYSKDVIAGIKTSKVANKETNDCVVKAVAASIGGYLRCSSFIR
jgi:hypothetical protein